MTDSYQRPIIFGLGGEFEVFKCKPIHSSRISENFNRGPSTNAYEKSGSIKLIALENCQLAAKTIEEERIEAIGL